MLQISVGGLTSDSGELCPQRTSSIIEGEDLLNDASAILMFDVLMDYHRSGDLALSSTWFSKAGALALFRH